jgi:magnesium transporter
LFGARGPVDRPELPPVPSGAFACPDGSKARRDRIRRGRGRAVGSLAHGAACGAGKYDARVPTLPLPRPRVRRPPRLGETLAPVETSNQQIIEAAGLRWIHIESPRTADRDWLEENFDFHALDFEDVYSRNQRPKLDQYDDYLFIVLHFPVFDKDSDRLLTSELDLFTGPDYLITLPNNPIPPLTAMFERYGEKADLRETTFSKGSGYLLYKIVDTCVDASFPMLRKMGLKLDRIEDDIFEQDTPDVVRDISNAKQEIINFRRIVRPMRAVLRDLERTKQRYLAEDLEVYFDDISDAAERIWDILENYKEVVEALESTNESAISHRLNDTLRVLTAFSVAFLPLTLIASIFGMNVDLPGDETIVEFWLIMALLVAIFGGLLYFFRRRGWL